MKLTHENVRAVFAWLERNGQPCECDRDERCDECLPLYTAQALAEQWLAAHTVRWDENTLRSADMRANYSVRPWGSLDWKAERHGPGGGWKFSNNLRTARAWCEEQARAEGFEVER